MRRQLNEVFFDRLYLDTDDVVDDRLAEPFDDFLYPRSLNRRRVAHTRGRRVGTQNGVTWDAGGGISAGAALLQRIAHREGLSKAAMVELVRLYSNPHVGATRLAQLRRDAMSHRSMAAESAARVPQRVRQRLGQEMIGRIIAEYERGISSNLLTLRYGIGKGTLLRLLREHGVVIRRRGKN